MCHDPRSYADGGVYTVSSWCVRQFGVEKEEKKRKHKKKQTSGPTALLDIGGKPKANLVKHKLFQISKRILGNVDMYREV
jgi:hypothetical protein